MITQKLIEIFKCTRLAKVVVIEKEDADQVFQTLCNLIPRFQPLSHEARLRLCNHKPWFLREEGYEDLGNKIYHHLITGKVWPTAEMGGKPFKVICITKGQSIVINRDAISNQAIVHVLSGDIELGYFDNDSPSSVFISAESQIVAAGEISLTIRNSKDKCAEVLFLEYGSLCAADEAPEIYAV